MGKVLPLLMDRLNMTKAFTMIESLMVLMILQVCMLCCIPHLHQDVSLYRMDECLKSELLGLQMKAMIENEPKEVKVEMDRVIVQHELLVCAQGVNFRINELGHVTKPSTLRLQNSKRELVMKIWLGNGRMVKDND